MSILFVVENVKSWPLTIPGVDVISARSYLTDPKYQGMRGARLFNLCRSYRYQTAGYYVSLLAMARGHKPIPSIATIQDMRTLAIIRLASDDLDEVMEQSLAKISSEKFTLSVYFGRNLARRYDRLSSHLFRLFQAPLLRAEFVRNSDKWQIQSIRPIAASDIPENHRPFVVEVTTEYLAQKRQTPRRIVPRYELAILVKPNEEHAPSNAKAVRKFVRAAKRLDLGVELIEQDDYGRLPEFDALFIRTTTFVNHFTYRFARRAMAEGLTVLDDPDSIAKCTNKVYLAELLGRYAIPTPKTLIVHRDNREAVPQLIGLPCILKEPDSSFSQGVVKVDDEAALQTAIDRLLDSSDLIIAQECLFTAFDWRVGILDRKPLYVCKYFMVKDHWQIVRKDGVGRTAYGHVETVPIDSVSRPIIKTALRAANLIGDGLYGVDLKQIGRKLYVIEVNDNPTIDAGFEDRLLKDDLYKTIMEVFLRRIQQRKEGK